MIKEKDELLKLRECEIKELQEIIHGLKVQEKNFKHELEKKDEIKSELDKELLLKDGMIEKLKHEVSDMRDSIQEMHKAHQTRLTNLTQQQQDEMEERIKVN